MEVLSDEWGSNISSGQQNPAGGSSWLKAVGVLDQRASVVTMLLDSWEQPQHDLWAVLLHQGHIPSSPTDGKQSPKKI